MKNKKDNFENWWMMWPLMQLNKSVAIINITLQLLDIYRNNMDQHSSSSSLKAFINMKDLYLEHVNVNVRNANNSTIT